MRGDADGDRVQMRHKKSSAAHIENDRKDREGMRKKIVTCIHPLEPDIDLEQLVTVASGSLALLSVNVDKAVIIAEKQAAEFEMSLPQEYWNTIEKRVTTMVVTRKGNENGPKVMYDT